MTRWLGIDYGKKRIGLALSDPGEQIASPATVLQASGTPAGDANLILKWAGEHEIEGLVVGLPLNMDGSRGPQAALSQQLADLLVRLSGIEVQMWDERLSSYVADQYMQAGQLSPTRRKQVRDALAAQVILQSFLDSRNTGGRDTGDPDTT